MNCHHCTAPTDNGLALCERCQIAASVIFEFLPVYFANLARWRPGRAGARPVPGSREPSALGGGGDDRIGRVMDEVGGDVSGWARALADDRPIDLPEQGEEAETVTALCRMFAENLTSIATLEWCGEFLRRMTEHEVSLRQLTERVAPGWYAGGCRQCGYATYVIPGLTWVTCSNGMCGATTYARDHLETILDEARGWVARPMRLAEAAVALIDTELSVPRLHKRISKWGEREQIDVVRQHEHMPKRYRFGEVLDRILAEGSTSLDEVLATKAS